MVTRLWTRLWMLTRREGVGSIRLPKKPNSLIGLPFPANGSNSTSTPSLHSTSYNTHPSPCWIPRKDNATGTENSLMAIIKLYCDHWCAVLC